MNVDIKELIKGTFRHITGNIPEDYRKRLSICGGCDMLRESSELGIKIFKCGQCGCPLSIRAKSDKGCPLGKW